MPNQLAVLERAQTTLIEVAIKFGPKLVVAILILVAGFYAARWVGAVFNRWLGKLQLEPPVRLLFVRVSRLLVAGLFLIMALQNLGVDLLPLIAGLGVAGAGIALAAIDAVVKANPRVLAEPAAVIGVSALADASIGIAVKPWVKVPEYGVAAAEINRAIVAKFRDAGVDYPASPPKMRVVDDD